MAGGHGSIETGELGDLALAILEAETIEGKLARLPAGAPDPRRSPAATDPRSPTGADPRRLSADPTDPRRLSADPTDPGRRPADPTDPGRRPADPTDPRRSRADPRRHALPTAPGRPPELCVLPGRAVRVPPVAGMRDPHQRARILHALANHELQAIELFAWALLAFPDAPALFRRGLAAILGEEQSHMRLYMERLGALGHRFGDFPVTAHFWNHLGQLSSPLGFVCVMGLTFENANLDFAQEYAAAARAAGDVETAEVLDRVHREEIRHVRFAWRWLRRWQGDRSSWLAYTDSLAPPLGPGRARGREMCLASRRAAGLDDEFIANLAAVPAIRPSGARR